MLNKHESFYLLTTQVHGGTSVTFLSHQYPARLFDWYLSPWKGKQHLVPNDSKIGVNTALKKGGKGCLFDKLYGLLQFQHKYRKCPSSSIEGL